MKKHLLLGFIPALMALSACNGAQPVENNIFLEDTDAHYELFGGSQEINELKGRRNEKTTTPSKPAIGYQIKYADDFISIRFIAALKELDVTAEWKRGVAGPDGSELRSKSFSDDAQETTTYYTSLTDGTETIVAGEDDYADYQGFVVYTLRNIPYTDNKDAYVAAYVNVTGTDTVSSEILAVKVEKKDGVLESKNSFSFSTSYEGDGKHFLQGVIEGKKQVLSATEYTEGDNAATYDDLDLKTTDSFGSFFYSSSIFQFFGYTTFAGSETKDLYFSSSGEYCIPKFDGAYTIYISRNDLNYIYASTTKTVSVNFTVNYATDSGQGVYVVGTMSDWTADKDNYRLSWTEGNNWVGTFTLTIGDELKFAIASYNDGGSVWKWEKGLNHMIKYDSSEITINSEGWDDWVS